MNGGIIPVHITTGSVGKEPPNQIGGNARSDISESPLSPLVACCAHRVRTKRSKLSTLSPNVRCHCARYLRLSRGPHADARPRTDARGRDGGVRGGGGRSKIGGAAFGGTAENKKARGKCP